jgi:hypothetical protein
MNLFELQAEINRLVEALGEDAAIDTEVEGLNIEINSEGHRARIRLELLMIDRIACLEHFKQLRVQGYASDDAMHKTVYDFAGLDYDNDEDDICNLQAFLSLNDTDTFDIDI